jgi:hypothetical protein
MTPSQLTVFPLPVGRGLEVWQNFSRCPAIEVSIFDDLPEPTQV